MRKGSTFLLVFCLVALSWAASAEDLFPPPWRGEWSTTSQYWEFSYPDKGDPNGLIPDGSPEGGQPYLESTRLWIVPEAGMDWLQEDQPLEYEPEQWVGFGVWPLSGYVDVLVDNHDPNPENVKLMWVQITWRPNDPAEGPVFEQFDPCPAVDPVVVNEILFDPTNPNGWRHTTYYWWLPYNPPDEWFRIGGDIHIDELVVDTWCTPIPEPTVLVLTGVGLLALLRRKRA